MDLKQIERTLFGDDTEQVNKGIGYQPPQQPQLKIITSEEVDSITDEASSLHGVPKQLIRAIIDNESDRTPDGKYIASGKSRVAGHPSSATGLMQLIDSTAKSMGVEDATDPKQNVMGGAKYLRSLMDRYNGDQEKALAAYFKGPKTVDEWLKQNPDVKQLPGDTGGTTVADYIGRVSKNIQKYGGKLEVSSTSQLAPDDINNPDYLSKILFGEIEPQQTKQVQPAQPPIGQTQRSEPFSMPGGIQEQEKEGIIPRLAKAWGRSVASLESGVGGALELTHIPGVKNIGQAVSEDAKAMREFYKVEDAGLVDQIAEGVSSGLQFLVPGLGVAKGAKVVSMLGNTANAAKIASWLGIGTNAVLEAAVESGNSYNALQEKGVDDKEATVRALGSFGANLALITATNAVGGMFGRNIDEVKKTLPQLIKEGAKKLPKEMLSEGFQESGQEVIGTVTEKEELDAKNIALAGGLGAITAGIMSPIGLISENQQRKSAGSETPSTIAEKTQPQQFDIVDEKGNVIPGAGRNEPPPIADDNPLIGAGRIQEPVVSPTEKADVPSVQTVPEEQPVDAVPPASTPEVKQEVLPTEPTTPKEITATEEQLKSVKEKVSGIEGIEFQGSNPGIEGKNKKTGESRFVPPTFEFKDKVSGGNFTLKEEDVTPERINIIVEGLRKNVKPEIEQKNPAVEPVEVKPTEPVSTKQETTEKPVEIKAESKPVKFSDWHKEQEEKYGLTKNTEVTYNVAGVEKTGKFTGFTKSKTGEAKARISIKTDTGYSIASVSPSTIKGIKTYEPVLEKKPEDVKKEVLSYDRPPEVQKEVEQVNVIPTDAQKEAGNYKKGHIKLSGMDISIENPAGSERRGKSPEGKEWSSKINHDYGYIRGTKGADAYRGNNTDQLDVFMNPGIKEDESRDVFIVNQKDPKTGKFDEHKIMVGFTNKNEAAKAYLSNYEKGWKGMKSIVRMPMDKFKEWAYSDQTQYELKENESEQDIISKMAEPIYKGGIEFQSRVGKVNEPEIRSSADRQAKQLYDDIQNKDIDKLTNRLPVLQNKASRKAFEIATGIMLPKTVGGTTEAIRKFVGEEKYDKHFLDIAQAQAAKVEEAKAKEYNTERDKLLDSKVPGQQGSTYRSLIDNHAKAGYSVKVDKVGIREVYKLVKAGEPVSTILPKKMIGEYALEKMPKYVEPAKSEFDTLTDDLREIDKEIAKEKQFNKKVELNKKYLEIINKLKKLDTGKEMSNEKEDSKKTETLLNTSEQRKPTEIPEAIPEYQKTTSSNLVDSYAEKLKTGEKIKNTREILDIADKVYGGTIGEGKYGIRDAYDALETAMNKHIEEKGLSENPKEAIASLNEAIKILPTQTVRTEGQVEKQQFSTPPSEAYLAVKASGIKEGMSGLEPSAGDGNIATMMRIANKGKGTIHVNEIDARRRENLKILGFDPTNHDAEYLHSTLPDNIKPDVVVMNPPFSSTGGRLKSHDTGFGAEHVRQALLRLKEGGRLVAIVGNGMAFGKPKMAAWWNRIKKDYNVRANVGISGKEYEKYGTGFDNNIIVIDKTGPTENIESAITGEGLTVEQGYDKLEPLMKEDVYGRIKGDVSEYGKTVDEEKPKGSVRGETADISGTPAVSGSGRGTDTKQGSRAKPKPVEDMGEPVGVGSESTGTVDTEGVQPGTGAEPVAETKQGPAKTVLPESGSGDVGRPGRKQERVQLKKEVKSSIEEESGGVYAKYKVKKAVYKGAVPHPANISESVTMASIEVPDVTYELAIPKSIITSGAISDAQLEAITYACQAHEQRLPNGMRKEYLIGDGCVSGDTLIFNPISGKSLSIKELYIKKEKHFVLSITKNGLTPAIADSPFIKGVAELFKIILEDGKEIVVTNNHRFLTPNGWMRIVDGLTSGSFISSLDTGCNDSVVYPSVHVSDGEHLKKKPEDCLDHYCYDLRLCDEQLLSDQDIFQGRSPQQDGALLRIQALLQKDDLDILQEYIHLSLLISRHSKNSSYTEESLDLSSILHLIGEESFLSLAEKHKVSGRSLSEIVLPHLQALKEVLCLNSFSCNKNARWNRIVSIEFYKKEEYYDMYVPGVQNYVANDVINHNTGMGKARTLLGIIYENSLRGKKKFVYITKSKGLVNQLKGDMEAMGINIPVIPLEKYKKGDKIDASEGILFGTYSTVSGDFSSSKGRYNQVLEWFGKDTDSVFVFDESHLMKNVSESYVPWGSEEDSVKQLSEGSQRGQMGVQFKKDLPNARFVNASATAATEPVNLAYLTRLGLWGEGTPFKDFIAFLNTMRDGGVGAMELLARDMKANGLYLARSISYDGVNYDTLNHVLAKDEKMIYNDMADFWSEILVKMEDAAKNANMKKESQRIMKQFYAAQQRFFLQLMMSFQVETMIKDADTKLKNGNSVVISLFNTNEQQTDKKVSEAINNGIDIDSMDFSPKDSMKQMIENNFPIYQYEEYNDDDGAKRVRQVIDPNTGEPLINKENLDMRQKLIDKIENFRTPENPIDRIVNHFGFEKVAEITGRKKRIVVVNGRKEYRDRATKGVAQKDINTHELKQFMNGDKRVAIISGAAATGFDLHASLKKKNQQRRVFYALQLSWSADEQMQSFGRVHRTMQASAPEIVLVKTDIASQQRLINTIQSRLASLGAISKGERESLSGGIFSIEDITDSYGTAALGQTIRDLDQADLIRMNAYNKEGNIKSAISQDVSGFLNRIMVLPIDKQNEAFAKFYSKYRDNVEHAKQTGTFDTGVEKISGENIRASGEPVVLNEDKSSGIKTELVTIDYEKKTNKELIQDRREMTADLFETKNKVSQRGYLYRFWKMDDKVSIYGPRGSHATISRVDFMQKYEKATKEEVEKSWKEEYDKIPDFETVTTHLITGSIFPVYNKIFFDAKQGRKIKRATLNDGRSLIGVEVSSTYIPKIKQNFGIGSNIYSASPQELVDLVKSGSIIELDNGWKISERRVMGEDRIEMDPGRSYVTAQQMEGLGLFNEIIAFSKRYFIPTDNEKSVSAMGNIIKQAKPVRDLAVKTEDASAPIEMEPEKADYSAPLSPSPEPMPVKSIIETTKNAPHGKKVEYAVASNKIGKQMVAKKTGRGLSFLDAKNKFYQKVVDLTWPISQIEDQWADDVGADRKKIRTIDVAISKVRGAGGMAKQFIEDNMTSILNTVPGKIRSKVYTELNKYLIAKRTVWLYENKDSYIDAGISVEDARSLVEFVETGAHSYSEEINRIAPRMWEFNKKLLQVKKDHGVIDDELLSNLAEPYYVPFYRDVDENTKLNIPKGEKYTNIGKGIKRLQGSTSGAGIIEPLQNMMQNSYETFVNAYRADVMNKIIDFAESSPELGKMFEKVPPKWVKVGTIEYRGEVDMILRPKLKEFANKLGITVEEKPRVAGFVGGKMKKVLGKSAGNKIELMIGATESQFSHELGHQLHKKYSKWVDPFIDGFVDELNEVADTRYLGLSVPASYVSYCRNRNEKFAEFVSMYITDRENLQTIAPNAFMEFETRIALDNNLRELIGFKPSNVSGMMTKEKNNWVQDWHVPQDREVVSVLREGKIVSYRCPVEVADAIKNIHPAMFPTWFRIFTLPMSILRKGAVTFNIGFIIPNSVRDNQESAFNAGTIPVYDFLIGLKEYITNGDMYKQYYRLGGGMDSVESGTRRFEKSVDDLKYGGKYGKFLDQMYWKQAGVLKGTLETGWAVLTSPFDLISKMGEASEMASRIGTYRRAVVGMPEWLKWYNNEVHNADEAIHIARQATVDFQRFGSYGRTANELIPFINAAIQGYDKMIRTAKDNPRRALLAAFLYVYGSMMAFWLWNKDKEGYKAVPLQDKINNFIIMNPDEKSWIKIPKGHIVKFIGNPVQFTMEKIYGTVLKSDASIIKQVLSDVSPIDISSIPVSLRLIIEPIANYDLYWNREIEKPYHKAILQAGLRSDKKTAEAIKVIGKALNISPIMMQHEIEIVGAGTAKNILWLADIAMGKIDAERFGLEKMPVTRSFYGKIGEWGTDIDSAIIMVNKELAKTRSFSIKKMVGYSGYTPEEIRKVSKANVEKIKLLYEKRSQLMKASEAIKHLRTTEE